MVQPLGEERNEFVVIEVKRKKKQAWWAQSARKNDIDFDGRQKLMISLCRRSISSSVRRHTGINQWGQMVYRLDFEKEVNRRKKTFFA
jgi:hypothetical protein